MAQQQTHKRAQQAQHGPLQGLLFSGLVLLFMFLRPQGLIAAEDVWRGRAGKDAPDVR